MAQPEKRENSVLFSLRELRQIEENRVKEEEHAVRSAEEARAAAAQDAEREARMRVESAEAMERQRNQAAIEQQRLQHEMELRRAEVAKKRPTWMLVVTGAALVAAILLVFFAIQYKRESDVDRAAKIEATEAKAKAEAIAKEAKDRVDQLDADMKAQNDRLAAADAALKTAVSDADRKEAQKNLDTLRRQKYEMEQRIAAARAQAAKIERGKGVHISKECLDNPLAKGC